MRRRLRFGLSRERSIASRIGRKSGMMLDIVAPSVRHDGRPARLSGFTCATKRASDWDLNTFHSARDDMPRTPFCQRTPGVLRGSVIIAAFCFALMSGHCPAVAQFLSTLPAPSIDASRGPGTLERVNYALELAQLGAENDMQDLSLTAVQRALGSGPPISVPLSLSGPGVMAATSSGLIMTSPQGNGDSGYANVMRDIEVRLSALDALWREHDFPPEQVYETLRSVVLPASRQGEIFLYARPILMQEPQRRVADSGLAGPSFALDVGSVGQLLAGWAVRSGHADELRADLAEYATSPRGSRPAAVLLGQLAIAEADGEALRAHLEELDQYLQQDSTQNAAELACHVALPAVEVVEARGAALPLLTRIVENATPSITSGSANVETLTTILRTNARAYFEDGDAEEGRRMLEKFLEVHQVNNQRYSGGDYPLYLRKQQLGVVAFELLRAGDVEAGLARLGERADIRTSRDYGTVSDAGLAGVLARGLGRLSTEERFETLLKFTFPENRPNLVRVVTEFIAVDAPPAVFTGDSGSNDPPFLPGTGVGGDVFSTATLLIETARELNRLDEITTRLKSLADNEVESASDFLLLANLAEGRLAGVRQRLTELTEEVRAAHQEDNRPPYPMFTHLFAVQAGQHQPLAQPTDKLWTQLVNFSKKIYDNSLKSHTRWAEANTLRNRSQNSSPDLLQTCAPAFWDPAGYETATEHSAGSAPNLWFAQSGLINHVCGPHDSNLFFRYPLTGDFEFSVNAQDGAHGEGNLSYGGLCVEIQGWGKTTMVYPDGRARESERHPMPFIRSGNVVFNRQAVEVRDGVATFYANGYRTYQDQNQNDPWLALHGDWGRNPGFADLRLTGNPVIPREVRLLDEQLRGWIAGFYGETQPNPLATVTTASDAAVVADAAPTDSAGEWDWSFVDGALSGRKLVSSAARDVQSRFYYHRPLQNGDVVHYEFYHEPGEVEVFPALGRLAFLLQSDGVALHWMTDGDADVTELSPDNRVTIAEEQVGARPLALQAGAWNDAELEFRDGIARISLNGEVVYEHVLDPRNDRLFGFFHYKDRTECRVRNAVLTGDWPEQVPAALLADMTSSRQLERSPADGRTLDSLLNERLFVLDAYNVYQQALGMPPEERYAWLADWVLPGPKHQPARCYAAVTPSHPAEPLARENRVDAEQLEGRLEYQSNRIEIGGNLVAPALELVAAAAELDRLDDLYQRVDQMPLFSANHVRARLAMLALISLEQQQPEAARTWLVELFAQLRKMDNFTMHFRWPSVIAASRAVLHEETRDIGIQMMEYVEDQQLHNGQPGDPDFNSQVRFIRGLGWALRDGVARGQFGSSGTNQWTALPLAQASTRGAGRTPVHWQFRPGQLLRYAPHEVDGAYFAIPLQGDYEVECRLTSFDWRETRLEAAGLYTAPVYTNDRFTTGFKRFRRPDVMIDPKLNSLSPWFNYRVVVKDGVYTSFVEGRELHQEQLPDHPDPWLSIASDAPYAGGVRELRITGDPEIPAELQLLAYNDLSNWIFDYYDETVTGDNPDWRVENGELVGRKRPEQAGMNVESVIRYHRPMQEDGEIEYEFRYEPGTVECHPALDRLVLLVGEEGVREHWLTDGMYDRTGVRHDNSSEQPEYRRGPEQIPLKADEWNRARLAVAGDVVTLTVNDVLVYERPIAPTNLRVFGLFHYADQTELRAKSVVQRGDWPQSLPPLAEQELAENPADVLVLRPDEAPEYWEADFTGSTFDASQMRVAGTQLGMLVRPAANGLEMELPAGEPKPSTVGAGPLFGLRGDFQIDATFEGLEITPPAQAWGAGIEVHVRFDDDYDSRVQFERRQFPNGNHSLAAAFHGRFADATPRWFKKDFWMSPDAGTLRIIRRGELMSFLFAPAGSVEFQLLEQFVAGDRDVRDVLIRTAASDQVAGVKVVWKSMSIRAGGFLDAAEVSAAPVTQLEFDLSREPVNGGRLQVPEKSGDRFVRRRRDGLAMTTPANQGQVFGVTTASRNYRLSGDFEVTADFDLRGLSAPNSGYGAGIQLRLSLDNAQQTLLHHCRRAYPNGPPAFAAHHVRMDENGNRLDDAQRVASEVMSGRMRLRREGKLVMWEVAEAESDEFEPIFTAEAGTEDVKAVDLVCESSQPSSGAVDVVWKRLQVRADRIQQ